MSAVILILFSLALCGAVRFMGALFGLLGYVAMSAMLMTRLPLMADIPIDVFGLRSNFGCLLFVPVLFSSAIATLRYGRVEAWVDTKAVFGTVLCGTAIFVLVHVSDFGGGTAEGHFRALIPGAARVVAASFLAFWFANGVTIFVAGRTHSGVYGQLAGQVVDSLIFFPIAFSHVEGFDLLTAAASGTAIKCGIALLTCPLLLGVRRKV